MQNCEWMGRSFGPNSNGLLNDREAHAAHAELLVHISITAQQPEAVGKAVRLKLCESGEFEPHRQGSKRRSEVLL